MLKLNRQMMKTQKERLDNRNQTLNDIIIKLLGKEKNTEGKTR